MEGFLFVEFHLFEPGDSALVILDSSEANGIKSLFDSDLRFLQVSGIDFSLVDARRGLVELIDLDPEGKVVLRMDEPEVRTRECLSAGLALVHDELALELA